MENQLREMFMLYGAPNAWSEFVSIRTDIKKKRIGENTRLNSKEQNKNPHTQQYNLQLTLTQLQLNQTVLGLFLIGML